MEKSKTENSSGTVSGAADISSVKVKTVSAGDSVMEYAVFGKGEKSFIIIPGLSIHSVIGSSDAIAEAYKLFSNDYTVYVLDIEKNIPDSYSVRNMADSIAFAIKELNIEKADIFGASLGGMAAMCLAINHPLTVNKVVLGSTFAKPTERFYELIDSWIKLAEEKKETELIKDFVEKVYSEGTLAIYRDFLISANSDISDSEYKQFLILAKAVRSFDCSDELSCINCPVLVMGSKGDKAITAEGMEHIAEALKCKLYMYGDEFGHAVYDEAPDYKQRIYDFFTDE